MFYANLATTEKCTLHPVKLDKMKRTEKKTREL